MNKWKETTLGEITEKVIDNRGKTPPIVGSGYEILEVNTISEEKREPDYSKVTKFVDEKTHKTWFRNDHIKENDILIPTVGTIGNVSFSKQNRGSIAQNLIALRIKEGYSPLFIYYKLKSPNFKRQILNLDIGGVQPSVKVPHLLTQEILLPALDEQKKIAAVLSSLDDKIELLRNQNETLEKIAQGIFKEWFVRFTIDGKKLKLKNGIPEGWRAGKLGDEFNITIGRTPPRGESEWFSNIPIGKKWISIKDMGNNEIYISNTSEYLTDEAVSKFNIPIIPENTTILSFKMTVGRLAITTEEMLSNEAIAHLKIKENSNLSTEFIFSFLKGLDFNSLGSTSSIVTAINSTMIKEIEVLVPKKEIMQKYNKVSLPIFEKLKTNNSQVQTLSHLRDTLLPKLMSGEVQVE